MLFSKNPDAVALCFGFFTRELAMGVIPNDLSCKRTITLFNLSMVLYCFLDIIFVSISFITLVDDDA